MNFNEAALKLHEEHHGKIEVVSKVPVKTRDDLSTAYTPGVAEPCRKIHDNKKDVYKYTAKGNLVAVVSDGTAVLGLGNIGPEAAMPVMEGKAVLFKEFGGVDAFPICLDTTDTEEIIKAVKYIAPCFGGINLEDIASPKCFEVEARLEKVAPGYDHITSAIGGAIAATYGASFLCYVTPAEHLRLPDLNDVKEGIIASKIAAHAADIAKGLPGARDWDDAMGAARHDLDWDKTFELSIDPEKAKAYREGAKPEKEDTCSMCGNFCAVKNMNRILDGEIVSIFDE